MRLRPWRPPAQPPRSLQPPGLSPRGAPPAFPQLCLGPLPRSLRLAAPLPLAWEGGPPLPLGKALPVSMRPVSPPALADAASCMTRSSIRPPAPTTTSCTARPSSKSTARASPPEPPPKKFRTPGALGSSVRQLSVQPLSSLDKEQSERARANKAWQELLDSFGSASELVRLADASRNAAEHRARPLASFAPSTALRALSAWRVWAEWCAPCEANACSPSVHDLLDFLLETSRGARTERKMHRGVRDVRWVASGMRWVAVHAQLPALLQGLANASVQAYASKAVVPRDRHEARPLPLAVVSALERRVASAECMPAERIFLGGILACIWSSLRFGDAQRCAPASITLESDIVRACCWKTKVTVHGQPWGLVALGVSSHEVTTSWASAWKADLESWSSACMPPPDFLIPDFHVKEGMPELLQRPMPYGRALALFRGALRAPWMGTAACTAPEARGYSLHSAKCTVLSWARQLLLPEEVRAEQGHHKPSSARASVRLYSRDDVWGALKVQREVIRALHDGWRPLSPQSRGAQPPAREPEVQLPPKPELPVHAASDSESSLAESLFGQACGHPASTQTVETASETRSAASTGTDSDSSGSSATEDVRQAPPDMVLVNIRSGTYHAVCTTVNVHAARRVQIGDFWCAARCGARLRASTADCALALSPPVHGVPCNRRGCREALLENEDDF